MSRFKLSTLFAVTVVTGFTIALAMQSMTVFNFYRYGRKIDPTTVKWVGMNGDSLKLEIEGDYYWSERSSAIKEFNFSALAGSPLPSIDFDRAWRWNNQTVYVRIGGEIVAANRKQKGQEKGVKDKKKVSGANGTAASD